MKIYLASSWRNANQPACLAALRGAGHDVYDFRHPEPGSEGFSWKQIDPNGNTDWTAERFRDALKHPVAKHGFRLDMEALAGCDACVLLLPCGRSAYLELGWATGAGKRTIVFVERYDEPELMYLMCDYIALTTAEVVEVLATFMSESRKCSCDAFCDAPCPVHARENALQNEVIELRNQVAARDEALARARLEVLDRTAERDEAEQERDEAREDYRLAAASLCGATWAHDGEVHPCIMGPRHAGKCTDAEGVTWSDADLFSDATHPGTRATGGEKG